MSLFVAPGSASMAFQIVPDGPLFSNIRNADEELTILLVLTASVLLIIAATIIFSLWFLRPLMHRKKPELKLGPTSGLRI